jgi:hypothetical protein
MRDLLSDDGRAFVTTVINAPTLDHIYLFSNVKQVLDLMHDSGLEVLDYYCAAAGDVALDKAEKKKKSINIALVLKRA